MKIAIAGCTGRMGSTLLRLGARTPGMELIGGSVEDDKHRPAVHASLIAENLPELFLTTDSRELFQHADAVIDFTAPAHSVALAREAAARGRIHVIGTTGFDDAQARALQDAARSAQIVQSSNFSVCVNLLARLVEETAALLGEEYDIEVAEMHHRYKKDAPSGTALMLAEAAASGRGVSLEEKKAAAREGQTGERRAGDIGIVSLRGGDVVGDHSVHFAGEGEVLELTHRAWSRDHYARGALRAALWARDKRPGLYSMRDVIAIA